MLNVKKETAADVEAIRKVTFEAFMASEFGHNGEVELVDSLRESGATFLSLVACEGRIVLGHILFSRVTLQSDGENVDGMGLAPMSVLPRWQGKGIGTALVNQGLNQVFKSGDPFVVVLGHPEYYPRFGFEPANQFGISHGFEGLPQELFFVKFNPDASPRTSWAGKALFGKEFGPQES